MEGNFATDELKLPLESHVANPSEVPTEVSSTSTVDTTKALEEMALSLEQRLRKFETASDNKREADSRGRADELDTPAIAADRKPRLPEQPGVILERVEKTLNALEWKVKA